MSELQAIRDAAHETYLARDAKPWERSAAYERERAQIEKAVHAFGKLNGWRAKEEYAFIPGRDGRWVDNCGIPIWADHPIYYKRQTGPRRWEPVALVGQPYSLWSSKDSGGTVEALKHSLGFGFILHAPPNPDASIWNPGSTLFLVVTKPGVEVRWLDEQMDPNWSTDRRDEAEMAEVRALIAEIQEWRSALVVRQDMGFFKWLETTKSNDKLVRDFISDARDDGDLPNAASWDELELYLICRGACREAVEAAKLAWEEFDGGRPTPSFGSRMEAQHE